MSSSIIKNAVIVVGVEQGQVNFKLPVAELDRVVKGNERLVKILASQAAKLEEVSAAHAKAGASATRASNRASASDAERFRKIDKSLSEWDKKVRESERNWERADRAIEKYEQAVVRAGTQSLTAFRQAGEGTFQFIRGIALLGTEGDENLRRVLKTVALIQGGFDVFKGISNVLSATINATRALAAAEKARVAAILAETAALRSRSTAQAISNVATARAIALASRFGPAVAVGAAAIGILVLAYQALTREENQFIATRRQLNEELAKGTRLLQENAQGFDRVSQVNSLSFGGNRNSGRLDAEIARLEKQKAELPRIATLRKESEAALAEALEDNKQNNGGNLARQVALINEFSQSFDKSAEQITRRQISLNEQLTSRIAERAQLRKQETQEKVRQGQLELQSAQHAERNLRTAQRALELEKQRVQSTQASLGRLDELGQARLRSIAAKRARGEALNATDLDLVSRLGESGSRFAQSQFAERGKGLAGLLEGITGESVNAGANAAQQAADNAQNLVNQLTGGKGIDALREQIEKRNGELKETHDKLVEDEAARITQLNDVLNKLVDALDRIETRIQASAE